MSALYSLACTNDVGFLSYRMKRNCPSKVFISLRNCGCRTEFCRNPAIQPVKSSIELIHCLVLLFLYLIELSYKCPTVFLCSPSALKQLGKIFVRCEMIVCYRTSCRLGKARPNHQNGDNLERTYPLSP
jgi:hypothetical protein